MKLSPLHLLLIASGFSLILTIEGYTSVIETPSSVFRESSDHKELNGVWRSRGYGWIWSIKNDRVKGYHETKNYCIESPFAVDEMAESFQISKTGQTIMLVFEDPAYKYTFDKINSLPEKCSKTGDKSAASVFNALNEIFATHYAFFETRKIDWTGIVEEARKKLNTETTGEDLFGIFQSLLSNIPDDHVSLIADIRGREIVFNSGPGETLKGLSAESLRTNIEYNVLLERWKRRIWSKNLGKALFRNISHEDAGGLIRYGFIDSDIGFLSITAMEGYADNEREELAVLDRTLDDAMKLFKDAAVVIVDVSLNDGGYDSVARRIAERFASKRTLAYSIYVGDAPAEQPQEIYIEPADRLRFTGPVYLLSSDFSVSAAEIFVMCMRALPNVTHVGQTTRGSLSDVLWKELPNKWKISLSNEVYLDAEGNMWEGTGIPPHIKIDVFSGDDPSSGFKSTVQSIVDMARTQKH